MNTTNKNSLHISRRNFCIGAAAAAAAVTLPGCASITQTTEARIGNMSVSRMGLGCMTMNSGNYNKPFTNAEMVPVIRSAYDAGVTFFDTAEVYGPFINEKLVGEALQPIRNHVRIATKFGWEIEYETGRRTGGLDSRPEHIRFVVENSLRSLRTDRIDLLYQHRVDPKIPIEDVAGTISDLMKEGKVLNWGLSEPGQKTLRRAHAECPVAAVQNEYSLMTRDPEKWILATCEELDITVVPWSPLAIGFLTGSINENSTFNGEGYRDYRASNPRFTPEALKANMPMVTFVKKWAARLNATPAQIALSWLNTRSSKIVSIPGTTRTDHMIENLGALNVHWSETDLAAFNAELAGIPVTGERLRAPLYALSEVEAAEKTN